MDEEMRSYLEAKARYEAAKRALAEAIASHPEQDSSWFGEEFEALVPMLLREGTD